MNKLNNTERIRILLIFFLSNACSVLISLQYFSSTDDNFDHYQVKATREGYSEIVIEAKLKTDFIDDSPISIVNDSGSLYIPHAFLLKKITPESSQRFDIQSESNGKEYYLIEVKNEFVQILLNQNNLMITPQLAKNFLIKKTKGANYELRF